jgi:hypothetical protein
MSRRIIRKAIKQIEHMPYALNLFPFASILYPDAAQPERNLINEGKKKYLAYIA